MHPKLGEWLDEVKAAVVERGAKIEHDPNKRSAILYLALPFTHKYFGHLATSASMRSSAASPVLYVDPSFMRPISAAVPWATNVMLCGRPPATVDEIRSRRPVRTSYGLADQFVVLGMRPDPKPNDALCCFHTHGAVVNANARRVEPIDLLEVERGMPRIALQLLETAVGEVLN